MAHPFFDAPVWPASRQEAKAFVRALALRFKVSADIDLLYREVDPELEPLNLGQKPSLVWVEALANLIAAGRLKTFCELLRTKGGNADFRGRLEAVFAATSDVERRVLRGGVLVVDREPLRSQIAQLVAADSLVTVLLVRGAPKSGKTHGHWLFDAAAREVGATPVYVGKDIVFTVYDTIRQLFAVLGGVPSALEKEMRAREEKHESPTTPDAWYRTVCEKLLTTATKRDARLWIAADDLGVDEHGGRFIDEEILRFFEQFGLMLQAAQYQARFRLMLIHYPDGKPSRWPNVIWTANTAQVDDIKEDAIVDFLRRWSQERGRAIVEEQLASLCQDVMAGLDAPPPPPPPPPAEPEPEVPRLQRLYELLVATTQRLEHQA